MNQDLEHIRLLSVFYYVMAGLSLLGMCCGGFYLFFGLAFAMSPDVFKTPHGQPPPPEVFKYIFPIVGGGIMFLSLTMSFILFFAGRSLATHKRHTFCLVVAGLICLSVPLGTTLGVFTFIVLLRPSVKELFNTDLL